MIIELYLNKVSSLGHRLPFYAQTTDYNVANDYIIAILLAIFFGCLLLVLKINSRYKYHVIGGWIVKCFMTLLVYLFHENHYTIDDFGYWSSPLTPEYAAGVNNGALQFGLINGSGSITTSLLIYNLNKIVPSFIANSYHSIKVIFTLISLFGTILYYRAATAFTQKENILFFWILLLFPSIFIWTSRIGKESLIFFTMSLYIFGLAHWHTKRLKRYLIITALGVLLTIYIRSWLGFILCSPLVLYFLFLKNISIKFRVSSITISFIATLFIFGICTKNFNLKSPEDTIKKLSTITQGLSGGGSSLPLPDKIKDAGDIFSYVPMKMFTVLFRPFPGDVSGSVGFLSGFEGILLLILFIRVIVRKRLTLARDPLILVCIFIVVSWAVLYSFAGQNFGTILRWKTQILPFFLGATLYLGVKKI